MLGDVRPFEMPWIHQEYAGDVQGDVAGADDHGAAAGEVEFVGRVVGMAVVPADEVGGGVAARQLFSANSEVAARWCADIGVINPAAVRPVFPMG